MNSETNTETSNEKISVGSRFDFIRLACSRHKPWGPSYPTSKFGHQTLSVTPVTGQISQIVFAGNGGYVQLDKINYSVP